MLRIHNYSKFFMKLRNQVLLFNNVLYKRQLYAKIEYTSLLESLELIMVGLHLEPETERETKTRISHHFTQITSLYF